MNLSKRGDAVIQVVPTDTLLEAQIFYVKIRHAYFKHVLNVKNTGTERSRVYVYYVEPTSQCMYTKFYFFSSI